MCDEDPGLGAGDGFLPILGEPPASTEPGKGAFDHPSAPQEFETLGDVGAFDDLQFQSPILASAPRNLN